MNEPNRIRVASPRHRPGRLILLVACAAASAAGCGLSDYRERVAESAARMTYHDQENKLLNGPAVLGGNAEGAREGKPPPVPVSLRVPKGIATQGGEVPGAALPAPGVLYRLAGPGEQGIHDVYVAVGPAGSRDAVLAFFKFPGNTSFTEAPWDRPDGRQLKFETLTFTEEGKTPTSDTVYSYTDGTNQVVLVYRLAPDVTDRAAALKAAQYSAGSLTVGAK